jgi:hypothetical protein
MIRNSLCSVHVIYYLDKFEMSRIKETYQRKSWEEVMHPYY